MAAPSLSTRTAPSRIASGRQHGQRPRHREQTHQLARATSSTNSTSTTSAPAPAQHQYQQQRSIRIIAPMHLTLLQAAFIVASLRIASVRYRCPRPRTALATATPLRITLLPQPQHPHSLQQQPRHRVRSTSIRSAISVKATPSQNLTSLQVTASAASGRYRQFALTMARAPSLAPLRPPALIAASCADIIIALPPSTVSLSLLLRSFTGCCVVQAHWLPLQSQSWCRRGISQSTKAGSQSAKQVSSIGEINTGVCISKDTLSVFCYRKPQCFRVKRL